MKFIKISIFALMMSLFTPVFVLATPCPSGTSLYTSSPSQTDFTISNTSDPISCAGWDISLIEVFYESFDTAITTFSSPANWDGIDVNLANPKEFAFFPVVGNGISPNDSLSGFHLDWDTTNNTGSYSILDVVLTFSPASTVPEPGTILLLGLALAVMGISGCVRMVIRNKNRVA